jgi:hypothetical protein
MFILKSKYAFAEKWSEFWQVLLLAKDCPPLYKVLKQNRTQHFTYERFEQKALALPSVADSPTRP